MRRVAPRRRNETLGATRWRLLRRPLPLVSSMRFESTHLTWRLTCPSGRPLLFTTGRDHGGRWTKGASSATHNWRHHAGQRPRRSLNHPGAIALPPHRPRPALLRWVAWLRSPPPLPALHPASVPPPARPVIWPPLADRLIYVMAGRRPKEYSVTETNSRISRHVQEGQQISPGS
jgi:hypothetical protein